VHIEISTYMIYYINKICTFQLIRKEIYLHVVDLHVGIATM